ncbi:MAG: hypothetical protein ACFFBP_04015 [Promethearchaeota archaeon]
MQVTRSEDILIFFGLTPNKIKKLSPISDTLAKFMTQKQSIDPSDRFNFIAFQEMAPSYLDHFTLDPTIVLNTLKSMEKELTRANLAGGIFVAITFIIEVYKTISQKNFRLIILCDDGSYKIPSQYLPVLQNLIDKVKNIPFFIDIIHINGYDLEESKKLASLAASTKGKYFEISKLKDLESILLTLTEKKYIRVEPSYAKKEPLILKENQPFYINLADDPIPINTLETCAICFKKSERGVVQCPKCETKTHKSCWAQWAKTSHIGIPHVFRCHICYNILKLDEKYVDDVQSGVIPTEEQLQEIEKRDIVKYMKDLETKEKPKMVHVEDPMAIMSEKMDEIRQNKTDKKRKKKSNIKVVICPICSNITTNLRQKCPTCGYQLL